MKKRNGTFVAMLFVIAFFTVSLVLPLARGTSPIAAGLDLSGGVIVTYRPDFESRLETYDGLSEEELLALAKETLKSRLYRSLSTIPEVVVRSDQRIVAAIPSEEDPQRLLALMGKTYHLTFRLVTGERDGKVDGAFFYHGRSLELAAPDFSGDMLDERYLQVVEGDPAAFDMESRSAKVGFRFRSPYDEAFTEMTEENVGRRLAILLDGEVEWAGTISSAIDGPGVLSGGYDLREATDIVRMLRSGSLPISLEVESLSAVGPSLGQEVRELGLGALGLTVALLAALVAVAYLGRGSLLVTGLASLACLLILLAGMVAVFGLTVDLVGVAGIILSVGMGMDAFLLVFESLAAAPPSRRADPGRTARRTYSFTGQGRTLFHANATTLIVVLLLLTSERLKSFAIFLFVGLLASVLTLFFTREMLRRTYGRIPDFGPDVLGRLRRLRPGIFRLRKVYFAALVVGLASTVFFLPSLKLGGDFQAGTQLIVSGGPVADAVAELGERYPDVSVRQQSLGSPGAERSLLTLDLVLAGGERLGEVFDAHALELEAVYSIDGKVSARRLLGSLSVLVASFALLALYFVAFQDPIDRFFSRRKTSPGSASSRLLVWGGVLAAVLADAATIAMALVWLGIPVNLPVVAALLTVIGYSVNDSVVLWSHVQGRRDEEGSPVAVVTRGVDAVLSRTVLTSLSTMVPALVLLAMGLEPLKDFAQVMIVGTLAGTLSSIFVVGSFAVRALAREEGSRARPRPFAVPARGGIEEAPI